MSQRILNFNPGPAALPLPVLEQVQHDLLNFADTGMSLLETSHRSAVYERVHHQTMADLRLLLGLTDDYAILFMAGGAQTQFGLVPMNLLPKQAQALYLVTGVWSATALREARKIGAARELWSSRATAYDRVPALGEWQPEPDAAYLHYTSNNTVVGTQYAGIPDADAVPLVCDMSSDLMSRPLEVSRFSLIYAGAQKNLGATGVTILIIRHDLLERCQPGLPATLSYADMASAQSLLNTPPTFSIYIVGLVAKYLLALGGLEAIATQNTKKARLLYQVIDASEGFYRGCAQPASRSLMNVTFRLPSPALERQFLEESLQAGMVGLAGHRSVRGLRASLYNAVALDAVLRLAEFMQQFEHKARSANASYCS